MARRYSFAMDKSRYDNPANRKLHSLFLYFSVWRSLVARVAWDDEAVGSSPTTETMYSGVAQLVEQTAVNRLVVGSSPTARAIMLR